MPQASMAISEQEAFQGEWGNANHVSKDEGKQAILE